MSLAADVDGEEFGLDFVTRRRGQTFDRRRAEDAVSELLASLGQDLDDPNLVDTPRRVAASYRDLLGYLPAEQLLGLSKLVGVVLEAEHLCMSIRGVQASGARTRTSRFTGALAPSGNEHFASAASR